MKIINTGVFVVTVAVVDAVIVAVVAVVVAVCWYLHAVLECAEVTDLCSKDEVSELRVCKENDEEHDSKTSDVFSTL